MNEFSQNSSQGISLYTKEFAQDKRWNKSRNKVTITDKWLISEPLLRVSFNQYMMAITQALGRKGKGVD